MKNFRDVVRLSGWATVPWAPLHPPASTLIEGSLGEVPSFRMVCPHLSEGKELKKQRNKADLPGLSWIVTSSLIYKML